MKLIVDISDNLYNVIKTDEYGLHKGKMYDIIRNGIPLDSNSEQAEVQAYFAGQTYGWEEGRKALLDDVKVEIKEKCDSWEKDGYLDEADAPNVALEIIDKHIEEEEDR